MYSIGLRSEKLLIKGRKMGVNVCILYVNRTRQGTAKMMLLYNSSEQGPGVISLHMANLFFKSLPHILIAVTIMSNGRSQVEEFNYFTNFLVEPLIFLIKVRPELFQS